MSKQIAIEQDEQGLTIRPTMLGRIAAALHLALVTLPLAYGGLVIFFAVDYIFRFAEEEPVAGLFWLSLLALALLVAFLVAIVRFLRHETWTFDAGQRAVIADVRGLFGSVGQGEADLREVEALVVQSRSWPAKSELLLRLESGEEEAVLSGRGLKGAVEEAAKAIERFMKEQRYPVDVERGPRGGAGANEANEANE